MRPIERPTAPPVSKRPPERVVDSGMITATSARPASPRAPATQNRACQSAISTITAASGRPRPPPMPSVALISAIPEPRRSGGSVSRMRLMPSGTALTATPCRARPTRTGTRSEVTAHSTEPTTSSPSVASRTRRLPIMSPSRPAIGVATAPASSVAVITQEAVADVVESSWGSWGTSGTTSVMHSEATSPTDDRTVTTSAGRGAPLPGAESTDSGSAGVRHASSRRT